MNSISALFRLSHKQSLHGITAGVFLAPATERATAFARIDAALTLIGTYDPARYALVHREIQRILVGAGGGGLAVYLPALSGCDLSLDYLIQPTTSEADVAATLVHEATHGRLYRLGYTYTDPHRGQIERICFKAERNFGLRLPDGQEVVHRAEQWLARDPADFAAAFSDVGLREMQLRTLREWGTPAWLLRILKPRTSRGAP